MYETPPAQCFCFIIAFVKNVSYVFLDLNGTQGTVSQYLNVKILEILRSATLKQNLLVLKKSIF